MILMFARQAKLYLKLRVAGELCINIFLQLYNLTLQDFLLFAPRNLPQCHAHSGYSVNFNCKDYYLQAPENQCRKMPEVVFTKFLHRLAFLLVNTNPNSTDLFQDTCCVSLPELDTRDLKKSRSCLDLQGAHS